MVGWWGLSWGSFFQLEVAEGAEDYLRSRGLVMVGFMLVVGLLLGNCLCN